jgi:hypothetical protein
MASLYYHLITGMHEMHQDRSNTVRTLGKMVYSKHPVICLVHRGIKMIICLDAIGFFSMLTAPLLIYMYFPLYFEAGSMKLEKNISYNVPQKRTFTVRYNTLNSK